MSKLSDQLKKISVASDEKKPALMTHVVLGYPSLKASIELVKTMAASGAALIELQIPFSDPMADGPSIMKASEAALKEGVTPIDCLKAMEKLSSEVEVPLLFMSYYNIVFTYGVDRFIEDAVSAGATGAIVPDIPIEEAADGFFESCKRQDFAAIPLVSPLTEDARMKTISNNTSKDGFVYCVSTTGTTGAREELPKELGSYLERVKTHFDIPRAVGFGLSKPEHLSALSGHAEIAVCGSAVINQIDSAIENKADINQTVGTFISKLIS